MAVGFKAENGGWKLSFSVMGHLGEGEGNILNVKVRLFLEVCLLVEIILLKPNLPQGARLSNGEGGYGFGKLFAFNLMACRYLVHWQ